MKYCPHCGAALIPGAVSFCPECGKSLPSEAGRLGNEVSSFPSDKTGFNPCNYDGYYNDVRPEDVEEHKKHKRNALQLKIGLLIGGAFVIIAACMVIMSLF